MIQSSKERKHRTKSMRVVVIKMPLVAQKLPKVVVFRSFRTEWMKKERNSHHSIQTTSGPVRSIQWHSLVFSVVSFVGNTKGRVVWTIFYTKFFWEQELVPKSKLPCICNILLPPPSPKGIKAVNDQKRFLTDPLGLSNALFCVFARWSLAASPVFPPRKQGLAKTKAAEK